MAKVKVRHALITYTDHDKIMDRDYQATAFRGMVVDISSQDEVDRLERLGAVVGPNTELERPGILLALPESPSEEEVLTWVMAASPDEIKALAAERPNLIEKLAGAKVRAEDNYRRQMELLGAASSVAREVTPDTHRVMTGQVGPDLVITGVDPATVPAGAAIAPGQQTADGGTQEGGTGTTADDASSGQQAAPDAPQEPPAITADEVVRGNAASVTEFIATHPDRAAEILEAEKRLNRPDGPRTSVVRAAEAAAGHTT